MPRFVPPAVGLVAFFALQGIALAAPPTIPGLEALGSSVVDFLIYGIGPIVFIIGLAWAAFSMFMGSPNGIHGAVRAIIAGAILFAAPHIVSFVRTAVG
jgi:hypothetical protein